MKDIKRLLELRKKSKKKKPNFVIKESHYKARVEVKWRYPRGLHSATRQGIVGRIVLPSVGFRSPKEVRGLHSSGLERVMVHNEKDLVALDAKKQGAVIGSGVGMKKKLSLLKIAQEKKIRVLNVRDVAATSGVLQGKFDERKKLKGEKFKLKSKKEEDKKKRAEEKKKKEEEEKAKATKEKSGASVEDTMQGVQEKAQEQKEEKDKVLTKKQA